MRTFLRTLGIAAVLGAATWSDEAHAKFVFPYNHPDLEWYSIETEHFVVHYPQSRKKEGNDHYLTTEWTAKKSAKVAEEMWPRMCAEFNYFLKEKIHIVLLNQSDDLEGFTIPNWDWIEVSANPGGDFYRQRGRMDWLPDVLVHEFAHVVSLKANGTMAEGAQGVSIGGLYSDGLHDTENGGEMYIMDADPFYWTEGGAEYWSDTSGYNWWTPSRDMHIRTTVLEERLLTYDEWQTRAQQFRWGDGERGYQQGYSFALYLRQRFGSETYAKFALEHSKGWRPDWNSVIEDVTGIPARTLYDDWVAYVTKKYQDQWGKVRAEGEVVGQELTLAPQDWNFASPDDRDAFYDLRWKRKKGVTGKELARIEREKAKEATGGWELVPQWSKDGKWYGQNSRGGVQVQQVPEDAFSAFTGKYAADGDALARVGAQTYGIPASFGHSWDFVPGQEAVVVTGSEHVKASPFTQVTGIRLETDGYDWKELWIAPIPQKGSKRSGKLVTNGPESEALRPNHIRWAKEDFEAWRAIPNTKRGSEPTVSPDGKKVAYLEYTDGVLNLVTINLDGTEKTYLTKFDDGTWMQRADWSPDGKQIVVGIFRNFQQDLYVMNADGTDVRPIMYDRWEDQDPYWATDGRIYFSSDRTGIFNIYAYDPATKRVKQITNVIGGAETPSITPQGNLVYTNYTGHGWKAFGVARADFMEKDVTKAFDLDWEPAAVQAAWEFREDLSMYQPRKYKGDLMAPTGSPMFRVTNDGLDNATVQAGGYIFLQDFVENHGAFVFGLLGEDVLVQAQYFYQGWYPTLFVTGVHASSKINYGFLLDDDNDSSTTGDQSTWEGRNHQFYNLGMVALTYPWNDRFSTTPYVRGYEYGFLTTSDEAFEPYLLGAEAGLMTNFTNLAWYSSSANVPAGRNVDLTYSYGYSDVIYLPYGGKSVDDGQLLDNYGYHKVEARWTEQIAIPAWGEFLSTLQAKRHMLQVDLAGGWINRNVDVNDEFRAGGQHPYYWGSDSLRPNTLFSGYPSYSLSGETMLIANLAYRFPIRRELNKRIGPFYVYDITGQIMGSAGNLWSFKQPQEAGSFYFNEYGDKVAYDESSITREIPFVHKAYKNGNYLLYDAGAELRVSSSLFNQMYWNSFVRAVYGFNEIKGYGDVNGDDIQDTTDSGIANSLSNETEKPGVRVYVGLGTGW
ncbi:MAG: hypothetical protein ACOZNI_09145 [Myxococcota bacterium]